MKSENMNDCIFCNLIKNNGDGGFGFLYEDDVVVAVYDKYPVAIGHALVISKIHVSDIFSATGEVLEGIMKATRIIAEKIKQETKATGVNIVHASGIDAQQSVPHLHFHIIPRHPNDNLDLWFHGQGKK